MSTKTVTTFTTTTTEASTAALGKRDQNALERARAAMKPGAVLVAVDRVAQAMTGKMNEIATMAAMAASPARPTLYGVDTSLSFEEQRVQCKATLFRFDRDGGDNQTTARYVRKNGFRICRWKCLARDVWARHGLEQWCDEHGRVLRQRRWSLGTLTGDEQMWLYVSSNAEWTYPALGTLAEPIMPVSMRHVLHDGKKATVQLQVAKPPPTETETDKKTTQKATAAADDNEVDVDDKQQAKVLRGPVALTYKMLVYSCRWDNGDKCGEERTVEAMRTSNGLWILGGHVHTRQWDQGTLHGVERRVRRKDGRVMMCRPWTRGCLNGNVVFYFRNGKPHCVVPYRGGVRQGIAVTKNRKDEIVRMTRWAGGKRDGQETVCSADLTRVEYRMWQCGVRVDGTGRVYWNAAMKKKKTNQFVVPTAAQKQ